MQKHIFLALFAALVFPAFTFGQSSSQALTAEMINSMHENYLKNPTNNALQNAITSNDIKNLVVDWDTKNDVDQYFKYKVTTSGITNQKSSGRCWLFTGLNVLRPIAAKKLDVKEFMFSQSYLFFYDQLEKANLFIEGIIETADKPMDDKRVEWHFKNVIGDGGQWTGVVDLVNKYGAVPAEVMPESYSAENTSQMSSVLEQLLKKDALIIRDLVAKKSSTKIINDRKMAMLSEVYRILALTLGEPVSKFTWRYTDKSGNIKELKDYTPKKFYDEFVGVKLTDYVMFMNDPSRPYNKVYEIDYDRHIIEGGNWKYINLSTEDLKKYALKSIQDNQAMYFSCDVGKQLDITRGYLDINNYDYNSLFSIDATMTKAERIKTFASSSSHGMTLVGADVDEQGKTTKWLLENSWGTKGFNGHLIMTDKWFDEYMFRLVVDKKYVDAQVLEILNQKSTLLPPWDPMFAQEM